MLKNIGTTKDSVEKIISEIYKNNVKFLAKSAEKVRKQEMLLCKQESDAILEAYERLLLESTKIVVNNLYTILESMVSDVTPNFLHNQQFISEIIKHEIDPIGDLEINFEEIEITTGSLNFHKAFFDAFALTLDYELSEDVLIFKYKDEIKSIDFSTLQTNMLRDVSSCRIKHLSMIDAIKMRL